MDWEGPRFEQVPREVNKALNLPCLSLDKQRKLYENQKC